MAKHVSADQVEVARNVDLIDYLERKGEPLKKEGRYYRHQVHDSLVIKDQLYAWNSRDEKGAGVINFAKMFYGMSFPEAVVDLNEQGYKIKENFQEQKPKEPYQYPSYYEVNDRTKAKDYLTKERKIHPKIVNWLDSKGLIAQDRLGNVVFKWKQQGEIVGADRQGTSPMKDGRMFKGIDRNSHGSAGFSVDIGKPSSIYLFESPIDALSYWSIKKEKLQNTRLVSMSGLKRQTMIDEIKRMGKEGHKVKQITFCTDNDKAGREFAEKYHKLLTNRLSFIDITESKDWNEELIKGKARVRKKEENFIEIS
ncbi:toprim domain-containing protein [Halobacillus karajensis]|uniref:DNA primase n=1 Tax=Halobacillus karajensis TaxID=195088 RepID=A0A059NZ47_9BACI|nr:toprim domain-containing protein [Halobacillus karajensis]CDQ20898.1 DNA primase [Halobacillus karajensis]CDQ23631.1 DNA primase [Halobacillus karajensis]CDQ27110.1 DNA primase [Halobacillus karajensis]